MAKIADAFSMIRNGANIKQGLDDSGYPITRIETISNRTIDRSKMGYAGVTDISKYADYVLQDGDILMSHINSETHLGKVAHYERQAGEKIIHGMNLLCLRPKKELVDSRFAFFYLSSEAFLRQIPRITKKSVNQASFNVAALKELTMPIPQIAEQRAVVASLDKVNELIVLRKEQLAKLDQLVKSRFIELFDSKGYGEVTVHSVLNTSFWLMPATPEFIIDGEVPYITSKNIKNRMIAFRKTLVDDMVRKVQELNKENFAVRQHLKFVELYSNPDNYTVLTYENTLQMRDELAPLITPDADEASAVRFDALMYGIELAYLMGKKYAKARTDLFKKVSGIASVANIPEIMVQSELINKILHTDYLENAGINEFEHIRENLRDLIKYIPIGRMTYTTNFADELLSMDWNESELENDDLKNYKMKAEFYIRQNQDNAVIAKLKTNQPLTSADVKVLEGILWSEVGTQQDYENEYGSKPLGEFVREIVGLDMNAAKEAFAEFLNDTSLDSNQIYFVNQIVEYIVHNGLMKDLSVLQGAPFTDNGSVVEVFTDLTVWLGIKRVIDRINANAIAA